MKEKIKNNICFIITFIILMVTIVSVIVIQKQLNSEEKSIYEAVLKHKVDFKDPDSVKVYSVKYCNENYAIIKIAANNSFGALTTDTYYLNHETLSQSDSVSKEVVKVCFEEELNNYEDVKVISEKGIEKINEKLKGMVK